MNIVAVDIGYGRVKVYNHKVNFSFPSYLARYKASDVNFFNIPDYIELDSYSFFVGEEAYTMGHLIPLIGEDFHGSVEWKALLSYSLKRYIEQSGEKEIDLLVLGLPLNHYNEKRKQKIKSTRVLNYSVNGISDTVKIKDIVVLPQGAGAVMLYQDKYSSLAIIDIGYYTVDLALFLDGKFVFDKSLSFNFGIHELYKTVAKSISKKFNYRPDIKKIEDIIKSKKVMIKGAEFNVSNIISECKLNYSFDLVNMIKEEWENSQKEAEKMIFIGGGAEIIKDILPEDPQFLIPDSPAFANAKGYMKYAESFYEQKSEKVMETGENTDENRVSAV